MICPVCKIKNLTSTVEYHGASATAKAWMPRYDELGNLENSDPNTLTQSYSCSLGHTFVVKTTKGNRETIITTNS